MADADGAYPAAKLNNPPKAPNGAPATAAPPPFPAPKSQGYTRPAYRPQPPPPSKRRRPARSRSCRATCCCCLCWTLLVVLALAVLFGAALGIFYLLYHPRGPAFTVSAARITALNVTSSPAAGTGSVTAGVNLTVTAKNPNSKMGIFYDDFAVSVSSAAGGGVPLGDGTVPGFWQDAGNTTVLRAAVSADAVSIDPSSASALQKSAGGSTISVSVELDTQAGVQIGSLRTKKIGVQVLCRGLRAAAPPKLTAAEAPAGSSTAVSGAGSDEACAVKLRVKIWKWTL